MDYSQGNHRCFAHKSKLGDESRTQEVMVAFRKICVTRFSEKCGKAWTTTRIFGIAATISRPSKTFSNVDNIGLCRQMCFESGSACKSAQFDLMNQICSIFDDLSFRSNPEKFSKNEDFEYLENNCGIVSGKNKII